MEDENFDIGFKKIIEYISGFCKKACGNDLSKWDDESFNRTDDYLVASSCYEMERSLARIVIEQNWNTEEIATKAIPADYPFDTISYFVEDKHVAFLLTNIQTLPLGVKAAGMSSSELKVLHKALFSVFKYIDSIFTLFTLRNSGAFSVREEMDFVLILGSIQIFCQPQQGFAKDASGSVIDFYSRLYTNEFKRKMAIARARKMLVDMADRFKS